MKEKHKQLFLMYGGYLHMSDALRAGMSRHTLYMMRDKGMVEEIARGIYRPTDLAPVEYPDQVAVSLRFPRAVICLVSALSFHDMTTQLHHPVEIAVPRNSRLPVLRYPPIRAHRFSDVSYQLGIETHMLDNVPVKIYDPEKTLVDCFKFRHRFGLVIFTEALKMYCSEKRVHFGKIWEYAQACGVAKKIEPYIDAMM